MPPKKVMIVDDSNMMRLVIRNVICTDPNLVVAGFAENGKKAIDELSVVEPDLILLDLEMPEMDGLEFLRQARTKTKAKVVVLSSVAVAGSPKAAAALRLGADAVVSKPSGAVSYDLKEARGTELFATIYRVMGMGTPTATR